ncbi:immunoglobulin superfamily DCC subclass member 3-like [Periophthalmus magnuspinnatus]|uniref:immunoglobulin superfamily DCC subclass member 3-like n=1 Tax=Periophthalmus magnuspinnatus TaxID=409849 RepID=UPI00145BEF04|nr:immunoglobulin superfamily DCC subclass member 3-like [Periophthalmus magnuspinnatus]
MLRLLLLLSGLSAVVGGASELRFIKEPGDVIAVRDRPLLLDCEAEGEGPISVTWRRKGVAVESSNRVNVLANGTLLIRKFSKRRLDNETDAGEYECAVTNSNGLVLVSRRARVRLASLSKFLSQPQSLVVPEGGMARLSCQVNGVPEANITWQRNRQALPTGDHRYTLLPVGILQISSVSRTDAGLFRCVASNVANTRHSDEAQLSVTVSGPRSYQDPVILSGPQNLTITVHQTAILECVATGNPRPIVSWSRLDGRSIGVEGVQVLGSGNLMISDASVDHSGVYVCSANRPGSRTRRTALGRLQVQAPPEFTQWPQSLSRSPGGNAVFTCTAAGVPEPSLTWLKNGRLLKANVNVRISNNNSTLVITRITAEDEAIYQCIAENTAGTNQASARLALTQGSDFPSCPTRVQAKPLTSSSIELSWDLPSPTGGASSPRDIIGFVVHIRKLGEPESKELQEAVSRSKFKHQLLNLEPATTYDLRVQSYSGLGACSGSTARTEITTLGGVPESPSFFTKVLNQTAMQVYWDLPKPGQVQGFRVLIQQAQSGQVQSGQGQSRQETLPAHINTHTFCHLESGGVYKVELVAFNGNGDSSPNRRLVSLSDTNTTGCDCSRGDHSSLLIGLHSGMACVLCCLLLVLLLQRHRSRTLKQDSGIRAKPENSELSQRNPLPPVVVSIQGPASPPTCISPTPDHTPDQGRVH